MDLHHRLRHFVNDDTGAVTVDWVVLTAAIVTLGFIVMFPIGDSMSSYSGSVSSLIGDRTMADASYK